jgi:hypothetical protein
VIGSTTAAETEFQVVEIDGVTIWIEGGPEGNIGSGGTLRLTQGADVMPRRLFFFHLEERPENRFFVRGIRQRDPEFYLVSDERVLKTFRPSATTVPGSVLFDVLISKHLAPFMIAEPAHAVLPLERSDDSWRDLDSATIAADPGLNSVMSGVLRALRRYKNDASASPLNVIEAPRRKLSAQNFDEPEGILVVQGVGGEVPTAASCPLSILRRDRLIVDQTLAWTIVDTDHADYLVGAFNSPALPRLLRGINPEGEQGGRHLHARPARITPDFDPDDPLHQQVVNATRLLSQEMRSRLDEVPLKYRSPAAHLSSRRRILRAFIAKLDSYAAYADATNLLYGFS